MLVAFGLMTLPDRASAAAATQLVFSGVPTTATAGQSFTLTVTAEDATNTPDPTYTGTVHFTTSDPVTSGLPADYTFTALDSGTHTFSVTLYTSGSQTVTATDTVTNSITGSSGAITVGPGPTTQLAVTAPSAATAGSPFDVTVTAEDAYNNVTPGYAGTAHFTSSDSSKNVALPSDYAFQAGDNGTHTFTSGATLATAGSQTITATDTVTASITGTSQPIQVSPGPTTQLAVTGPGTTPPNTPFGVTVTALDGDGNLTPAYTGTIAFSSSDKKATLPGQYTFVAGDNGSHAFNGLVLQKAGTQSVTATDTTTSTITGSATVDVSTVNPAKFVFINPPTTTTAGQPFSLELQAQYSDGTVDINYTGTVTFGSTDKKAAYPTTYTFTSADAGDATIPGFALKTAGPQDISATDTSLNETADTGPITVAPAATAGFTFGPNPFPNEIAGNAFPLTVNAVDAFGNPTSTYTGTVTFSSSDAGAHLPAGYTFTAADGGSHTFTPGTVPGGITLYQTGSTVTVTDANNAAVTSTSAAVPLTQPDVSLTASAAQTQIVKGGSLVNFTLSVSSSGNPLSIPSDITQPATTFVTPGSYSIGCPSYLTCALQTTTLTGTSPFTLSVKVTQNTDGYFDPTGVSLTLMTPSTGDVALLASPPPANSVSASANIISEVSPPPGLSIGVGTPNPVSLPAGGQMDFPVTLFQNGLSSPTVTAGAPIQVSYTVNCPLPSNIVTCTGSAKPVTIQPGQTGTTLPVTITAVDKNAYFPALPVTVTVTNPVGQYGTQIGIMNKGQNTGMISSTVPPPVVTLVEPTADKTVYIPADAGNHDYTVQLSPAAGTAAVDVAVPLTVTFTAGGIPGYSSCAEPGVDFALPNLAYNTATCPSGTGSVVFQPVNGIDPMTMPISVDFLNRSAHGPNRYFELKLTQAADYVLGAVTSGDTLITDTLNDGYWLVGTDGGVFTAGTAVFKGSAAGQKLASPVIAITPSPTGRGYWLASSDGGVFAYGDARFYGSVFGDKLDSKIVGIAATPTGHGYWLVAGDGGVFAFGDARFFGSLAGIKLVGGIVGIQATRDGAGYYMVGSDGGVFAFGDAHFLGSLPVYCGICAASSPILGMAVDVTGDGYWLAAQNGGVFAFGKGAHYYGSAFNPAADKYYVAITSTLSGDGYWLLATDGTVASFGSATKLGGAPSRLSAPLENMAGD